MILQLLLNYYSAETPFNDTVDGTHATSPFDLCKCYYRERVRRLVECAHGTAIPSSGHIQFQTVSSILIDEFQTDIRRYSKREALFEALSVFIQHLRCKRKACHG